MALAAALEEAFGSGQAAVFRWVVLVELRVAAAQPLLEAAAGRVDVEPASAVGAVAVDELGRSEREVAGGEQVLLVAEQDGELALEDAEAVGVVVMDVRLGGARARVFR